MNKKQVIAKIGVTGLETAAFGLDTFALPIGRKTQEKVVRRLYKESNLIHTQVKLPRKTYHRLNSKGQNEVIT